MDKVVSKLLSYKPGAVPSFEIYATTSQKVDLEAKGGKLRHYSVADETSYAIRVLRGRSIGFSYGIGLEPASIGATWDSAVASARLSRSDRFNILPCSANYEKTSFDQGETLDIPRLGRRLCELESKATRSRKVLGTEGFSCGVSRLATSIFSSQGIDTTRSDRTMSAAIGLVGNDKGDKREAYEYCFSRSTEKFDLEEVVASAQAKLKAKFHPRAIRRFEGSAVFSGECVAAMLDVLSRSFSAPNVSRSKSLFRLGDLGTKVFSDTVTIANDPFDPEGPASRAFDDEGSPAVRYNLVTDGVLAGFAADSLWSRKLNLPNFGNALRPSVKTPPKPAPLNLTLAPGRSTLAALFARSRELVYVTELMGLHLANPVTGEFNLGCEGFMVKDGKIAYPVAGFVVSSDLTSIFSRVISVGATGRFYGDIKAPPLLADGIVFTGESRS